MHTLAAGRIVGSVKKRIAQGDCPTEKAFDVETLEEALVEVHRLFEAEQRQREKLETSLRRIKHAVDSHVPNCEFKDVIFEMIDQDLSAMRL